MRTTKGDAPCSPVHGGWWVDFAFKVTACGLMVWTVFWCKCGLSFVLDCLLWFGLSYGSDGLLVAHTRGLRAGRVGAGYCTEMPAGSCGQWPKQQQQLKIMIYI